MILCWDARELELHNAAWKAAKVEMLGSADADIPPAWFSVIAQRAEVIRKNMPTRKADL
jgi:hypothetical protein